MTQYSIKGSDTSWKLGASNPKADLSVELIVREIESLYAFSLAESSACGFHTNRGGCVWFTGLSGSGKTTTAITVKSLLASYSRSSVILDGDSIRALLSHRLGYCAEHRDANARAIALIAKRIVLEGGIAICATISPYRESRLAVKEIVGASAFVEVFVNAPLSICEQRDTKGLYSRARMGEIAHFTGISDPYERPLNPDIEIDSVNVGPRYNSRLVLEELKRRGIL